MTHASIDSISGTIRLPNYALHLNHDFCEVSLLENNDLMIKLGVDRQEFSRQIIKNDLVASVHIGAKAFEHAGLESGDYGMCLINEGIKIHCGSVNND